jgi:hypothetical protein
MAPVGEDFMRPSNTEVPKEFARILFRLIGWPTIVLRLAVRSEAKRTGGRVKTWPI